MKIRKAEEKDIPRIMELLSQVLQIHAEIRPDVFIPGTTKYTDSELKELLAQEDKPIYVAAGEDDVCMGYAFWFRLRHCLLMICALTSRHADSVSGKACLNM